MRLLRLLSAAAAVAALTPAVSSQGVNYGNACAGESGTVPTIGISGFPTVGGSFTLEITGAPSTMGLLAVGPMPIDPGFALDPFGYPGCELLVMQTVLDPLMTDGTGAQSIGPINTWGVAGATIYCQAFLMDSGVTTDGALSDGLAVTSIAPSGFTGGEIIITEFMKDPNFVGDGDGEFIEVYNTTGSPIDIEDWILSDNDFDSTVLDNGGAGIVVPAGGFVVLGANADSGANGGITVDYEYAQNGQMFLSNSADEIVLTDYSGVEIDRIEYDDGVLWAEAPGESLELDALAYDGTSNDDPSNWALSTCTIAGSPCNPDTGTSGGDPNSCSTSPCVTSGSGEVIFTEVMQNPAAVSDSDGEWLELYNTTGAPIDIDGWSLILGGCTEVISGPLVIAAGDYILLAENGDPLVNGGLPTPDYLYSTSCFLGNSSASLQLLDDSLSLVAQIDYDNGATFPDPNGASMTLEPTLHDVTSAEDGSNWCEATSSYGDGDLGTPGTANDSCVPPPAGPGDMVITEIIQNPAAVADGSGEWFEIYNNTSDPIDIEGWTISDLGADSHTIANGGLGVVVAAGSYAVLGINGDSLTNGGVTVDYVYSGFNLANGDDEIILMDGLSEVDRVEYDGGPGFPDPTGASMTFDGLQAPDHIANDDGANWCETTSAYGDGDLGTPGAANDTCGAPPVGPGDLVITEIIQNPSAVADGSGEWFEVHNTTAFPIDMEGMTISDDGADSHLIDAAGAGVSVPAGGYIVLGINADSLTNGGVTVAYEYSSFNLANGDDEVVLSLGAIEIDRVNYDGGPGFPDPTGASMTFNGALTPDATANDAGANWCEATSSYGDGDLGTPGAANDVCP